MKKTVFAKALAFLFLFSLALICLGGCSNTSDNTSSASPEDETETYVVTVKTVGGMPLENVLVKVYSDLTHNDLVWGGETDSEGRISFTAESGPDYVVTLESVPEGYVYSVDYPITGTNTEIALKTEMREGLDISECSYKLGSIVHDFSVTATDGNVYKLSELLAEKKAVILNFWFTTCGPCKMEFPYLQQAYEEYKDVIEVLALNPYDGTEESVAAYASEMGLTFPVSKCDFGWQTCMQLKAYPTTVVIDRYGMIAFIHTGSITDKETFVKIFSHFTSDDYRQATYRNISDIK